MPSRFLSNRSRGTVVDKTSQSPLPGANITVLTTDPVMGASTDQEGKFIITERSYRQALDTGQLCRILDSDL